MIMQTFRKREGSYPTLEELEKSYIEWILKETGDNKTEGAKALDIDRYPLGGELRECEMK